MKISEDISKEELAAFLEETDEELKLLDEDLILLEKNGASSEIVQEIFRAAHTLKGSSGMLGYEKMSKMAHAMETVLDKLRSGNLQISTEMIDALLGGLDILKSLREILVSDEEPDSVDIIRATGILEKIASDGPLSEENVEESEGAAQVSTEESSSIAQAQQQGYNSYKVRITVDNNSSWIAVRQFQLVSELGQLGEIISSQPSRGDIESGKVGPELELVLVCSAEQALLEKTINTVPEVTAIQIDSIDNAAPVNTTEKTSDQMPVQPADKGTATPAVKKSSQTSETVRVDVKLLDNLINLVGEMVIDRNRIRQISRKLEIKYEGDEVVETLGETSVHMVKLVSDLQENILRARMLHIGTILNGFPRLVRDLAQKANKKIDFIIEGQETELDRSIIEQIRDPLLHILRNSVDHGIESPAKRKEIGKPEKGTIRLSAYHEQSQIVVSISDDGGGIDAEKVRQSSVRKGFISAEAAARLSTVEAQNLIFMSGVSTAEKVSDISGRGVGMDVVKTNISNVGGSVSVESKPGQGTTIKMRLPLTLATIDGILVSSGGLVYVLPISVIVEILRLNADQIQSVMGREVFRLRDNVISLIRLSQRFEQKPVQTADSDEVNVVVIKVGDQLSGLIVDSVLEPQESVVKPLGKYIGSLNGIAGATIMGDGQVALILDTATLVKDNQINTQ
ncbi:MAG: chemotaxis protein CheA [Dehalococcoidales bacterium]|nr:chemotaxis protein CheA [Dehalococcoidales bacterium]